MFFIFSMFVIFSIFSSWVNVQLHTKNKLSSFPGGGLKSSCGGVGGKNSVFDFGYIIDLTKPNNN